MTEEISPPIVTDDNGDLEVFRTARDACMGVEATDVASGVYEVFDSRGKRLTFVLDHGRVAIRAIEDRATGEAELLYRMLRYIERVGFDRVGIDSSANFDLRTLVDDVLTFQGK